VSGTLRDEVSALHWYHTLELPDGIVTPGEYDLRPAVARMSFPDSLEGKRCLDVGTQDGFWAFEMERRGAAEVVAIDVSSVSQYDFALPPSDVSPALIESLGAERRTGFEVAHRALGSRVLHRERSVYDLDAAVDGTFDFATLGTLLTHLRDPVGALQALHGVLRGELLCNEAVSLTLSAMHPRRPTARMLELGGAPFWWLPNVKALRRWLDVAGFEVARSGGPYLLRPGGGFRAPPFRLGRAASVTPFGQVLLRIGAPHVWSLARPR
jgi:tRNA (mo5U34)-methyltransferase